VRFYTLIIAAVESKYLGDVLFFDGYQGITVYFPDFNFLQHGREA